MARVTVNFEDVVLESAPVPADWYKVLIKKAEIKQPREAENSKGEKKFPYLNCQFEITSGAYAGRIIYDMFTLKPGKDAQGRTNNRMLYKLLTVLGLVESEGEVAFDDYDLQGKEIDVKIRIQEGKDGQGEVQQQNRISEIEELGSQDTSGVNSVQETADVDSMLDMFSDVSKG